MSNLESRLSAKLEGAQLTAALHRMRSMPRYALEIERRIAALGPDQDLIDQAILKLRSMRDPHKCPEEWLFLLAWDLSVDVWDANWNLETKRKVCAASWIIHRHKGTKMAIEEALKALGMRVRLIRWFDFDPPKARGTFEARIYMGESIFQDDATLLTDRSQRHAVEAITRSKPLTRHFTADFGIAFTTNLFTGMTAQRSRKVRINGAYPSDLSFQSSITYAAQSRSLRVIRIKGPVVEDQTFNPTSFTGINSRRLRMIRINGKAA